MKVTKNYDSFHLTYAPYMTPRDIRESRSGLYARGRHVETRTSGTYSEREEAIELLTDCLKSLGSICRIMRVQRLPRDHRGYTVEIEYEIH